MWWAEAGKYNVLPLDDQTHELLLAREINEKTSYTFYPGTVRVPQDSAPHTKNRSYSILAEVEIPAGGAEGPICAVGGVGSGWSMYIKDQKLMFCYNNNGERYYVRFRETLPTDVKLNLRYEFEKQAKKSLEPEVWECSKSSSND
jgi:arylsulfatase